MKIKTWHVEQAVIGAVLAIVWLATGCKWIEAIGSLAVLFNHKVASISSRMQEREALKAKPDVECYRAFWPSYIAKEVLWFAYFLLTGAWSALVGCTLFAAYPLWRKLWRSWYPLSKEKT